MRYELRRYTKRKARISCTFLADQHGVGSKKHLKKGEGGGAAADLYMYMLAEHIYIYNKHKAEWRYTTWEQEGRLTDVILLSLIEQRG